MNKGFTLMELLGVLVILSLLMIILVPNVLEQINNKKGEVSEAQTETILAATELYIDENPNVFYPGYKGCISFDTLQDNGKLSKALINEVMDDFNYKGVNVNIDTNSKKSLALTRSCQES